MKVAVIMGQVSSGGISRFQRLLTQSLVKNFKDIKLDIYAGEGIIQRDKLKDLEQNKQVRILALEDFGMPKVDLATVGKDYGVKRTPLMIKAREFLKKSRIVVAIYYFFKEKIFNKDVPWYVFKLNKKIISRLADYDLVYLPSAGFIEPIRISRPIVVTFHDFNNKHKEFSANFSPRMLNILDRQLKIWFKIFKRIINSSKFIQGELKEFYPEAYSRSRVVYLTTLGNVGSRKFDIKKYLKKFNLPDNYILYPARISSHKNLVNLIKALGILKKEGFSIPLVLSGDNTKKLSKEYKNFSDQTLRMTNKAFFESKMELEKDIYPLGYVSDEDIDALIQGSKIVVSPSLYEAASGPGVDAWHVGIPVALSNIPSHLEQLEFLGTKAWVFDPNDPKDIAKVLKEALQNDKKREEMARISKEAIDRYTWDDVAKGYYKVFEEAVKE